MPKYQCFFSKRFKFRKKAGGAPANVAAAITKLGGHATFMGQVGNDPFGEFLEQTLQHAHVDTSMLIKDKQNHTCIRIYRSKW